MAKYVIEENELKNFLKDSLILMVIQVGGKKNFFDFMRKNFSNRISIPEDEKDFTLDYIIDQMIKIDYMTLEDILYAK